MFSTGVLPSIFYAYASAVITWFLILLIAAWQEDFFWRLRTND